MSLAEAKKKIEAQRGIRILVTEAPVVDIGALRKRTSVVMKEIPAPEPPKIILPEKPQLILPRKKPFLTPPQREALVHGGAALLTNPIPAGYSALGKNDVQKLLWYKSRIEELKITAFDYETDGDPDDETQDPQDHKLVGVSFCCELGTAVYLPIAHDSYGANWDLDWLVHHFMKPVLEHPDIMVIAHNIKVEHQWSLLHGIDMFPKATAGKVMDTMIMVKALALPENTEYRGTDGWSVVVGLKPVTKALLAHPHTGMVHKLIHIDDIQSFKDTVGTVSWEEPTGEFHTRGKNKGLPKMQKMTRSRTFNELPVDKHSVDYGCSDSDWALGVYYKLLPLCVSEGLLETIQELDIPRMMVLGEYELAGWKINPERLKEMGVTADQALAEIEPQLMKALGEITEGCADFDEEARLIVPAGNYKMGKWRGDPVELNIKTAKIFNWGSTQHMQWLLYYALEIPTEGIERSKTTGLPGTGKDILDGIIESYGGDNAFMKTLKEKRKYDKIKSTYVDGLLPFCREDTQKIHTAFNLVSTWRLSSKKPNLQNIPRAENDPMGIRGVFEAPTYDPNGDYSKLNPFTKPVHIIAERKLSGETVLVNADYAQIELKVLAWYAMELAMIDVLVHGGDLHAWVAKQVFKLACSVEEVKDLFKPLRYRSKKVNFGIVYGMTEFGLSKDPKMGMTVEEAKQFILNYYDTFPGIRVYAKEQIAFARKYGYVQTLFGHRRPIPDINDPNKWVRKGAENKAMNTPIQGSAADIIALAMVNLRKEYPMHKAPFMKPVIQIHDEIQCEVPIEYAVEAALKLKEVMERPIEGFSDIMPIIAEPAIGKIWSHALDLKFDGHGNPYVKPKKEKKEATDVTYAEIEYALPLYKLAGIEVH